MPWSFALPQAIFESPLLATLTPIATGSTIGYLVNRHGTKPKYATLKQPPLAPPAWLFPPVWTLLYGLTGYASYHATKSLTSLTLSTYPSETQILYTAQLALNHVWMPLFFGLRKPALAAVDILALGGTVAALMREWWDTDRFAFWLFTPYAAWLGYATYLNFGVGILNGWTVPAEDKARSEAKGKGREE
ncbi:TspO/MBR family protein [Aspergillus undulatus]|uniref:TspO/MBR family protein n=1 Tax=Aspergillus undulatus TaxID=1810928 RepID=UPI003CCD27C2